MMGLRAALYCRVDGGGNAEMRRSVLAAQALRLERCAADRKLRISGLYVDDGCSGCGLNRPGLDRLLKDYASGAFDVVLVVSRSRLYRGRGPQWPFPICSLRSQEMVKE